MYKISKRLTMAWAFLGLACGFLLTQQPTKAATTSQAVTPTTQVVKADSNILDQGVDGTCKWDVVKDGDEVVLTIHAGQLVPGYLSGKINYYLSNKITKIVIDPDVIVPKDSSLLFSRFSGVKEFVGLSNLDTSQVTDMSAMFKYCMNLEQINVKSFNTKNVKNMDYMFFGCTKLRKLDISSFETPKLEDAGEMFGEDHIDYLDMRNLNSSLIKYDYLFELGYICKLTVGPKFTNICFPQLFIGQIFDDNGIKKITSGFNWIILNGPDKGTKKSPGEMIDVKRDQPVTYVIENKPLINPYNEYKTVTRTINLHLPYQYNNEIISFTQKATIHRQVTVNDDEKAYGEWSKDYWDEYNAPKTDVVIPKPAKVDKQIVDGNTKDQTVDIYY